MHNRLFFLKSLKWRREDFPVLSILWWLAIIINNIQMSSYLSFSLVHISSFYLTTTICLSYNLSVCKIALTFIQPYMQIMTQDDRSSYFVIFVTFYVFTFSEVHGKLYQFWYDMLLSGFTSSITTLYRLYQWMKMFVSLMHTDKEIGYTHFCLIEKYSFMTCLLPCRWNHTS